MKKQVIDFILTGLTMILGYAIYSIVAVLSTILLGVPVAFGIKYVIQITNWLWTYAFV